MVDAELSMLYKIECSPLRATLYLFIYASYYVCCVTYRLKWKCCARFRCLAYSSFEAFILPR